MRVTKVIKGFIENEVSTRLQPKYEVDRQESLRQQRAKEEFIEGCEEAAEKAYRDYWQKHWHEIADFCKDNRDDTCRYKFYNTPVLLKGNTEYNSVHGWNRRKKDEAAKIVNDIILELELGGTKDRLMEMLESVGRS